MPLFICGRSTNPGLVSKISKARKMTKNHYYRDDPAFVVLQIVFLVAVTLAFGIATVSRPLHILYNMLYQVAMNYLAVGALMTTGVWLFVNRVLMGSGQLHEIRRQVDWQHSFDIHCDAYFVYFVCTHVGQFILLPVVLGDSFLCRLIANSLYALGVAAYCMHTFRGYVDLPMLTHQHVLLYPAVLDCCLTVDDFVTHLNMSHGTSQRLAVERLMSETNQGGEEYKKLVFASSRTVKILCVTI